MLAPAVTVALEVDEAEVVEVILGFLGSVAPHLARFLQLAWQVGFPGLQALTHWVPASVHWKKGIVWVYSVALGV